MAHPDGEEQVAVLLIAHGSRHAPANDDLLRLAGRFAGRAEYPIVEASFLELADPDIEAGGDRCVARGATRVLMIPYFLSAGVHLLRDLTAARDALRLRHPAGSASSTPATRPRPSPHRRSWPNFMRRWTVTARRDGPLAGRPRSSRLDTFGSSD
ncbi:MAG: CbiX/SirB N-terminal domain-containing protein [Planctomycetia bacterium]|nr:CbiX/SirB N-terminal domain-containing protein [Planctomycetia bacterium]